MNKNKLLAYVRKTLSDLHKWEKNIPASDGFDKGWFNGAIGEVSALEARIVRGEFDA